MGDPFFCKYVCPQGILEGRILLSIANKGIRNSFGILFASKLTILLIIILLSVIFYRPFCKWIYPLGAFYSFFNKIVLYNYKFNVDRCVGCNKCKNSCKMDVDIRENTSHMECIKACPTNATSSVFTFNEKEQGKVITENIEIKKKEIFNE